MADDDEYTEATPEQKLNIATYFIMSSPTGEVDEVLADVQKLVASPNVLNTQAISAILKDYNTEHFTAAPAPGDTNRGVLVTKHGLVADNQFLDPETGKVLQFDHIKRVFTGETDKKQVLADAVDRYRKSIGHAVQSYINEGYKSGKVVSSVYGADNGQITICISAKNVNLANYWTGGWRSIYSLNVSKKGNAELKGNIKINVHYFEDGNVQLHTTIDKNASIPVSDEDSTAKSLAKTINEMETDFQNNLEEMYVNMHRNTFKAMRRFLPIHGNKMTWNVHAHSLANEVNKAS